MVSNRPGRSGMAGRRGSGKAHEFRLGGSPPAGGEPESRFGRPPADDDSEVGETTRADAAMVQPIWHLGSAHLAGFALRPGMPLATEDWPRRLLQAAGALPGLLFVPWAGGSEEAAAPAGSWTHLSESRSPDTVVLDIPEETALAWSEVPAWLRRLRRQGVRFCLSLGQTGAAGHRPVYGLRPAFVRMRPPARGTSDPTLRELRTWVRWAHGLAARIVADGVPSAEEATLLAAAGVDYALGEGLGEAGPAETWALRLAERPGRWLAPVRLGARSGAEAAPTLAIELPALRSGGPGVPLLGQLQVPALVLDGAGRVVGYNAAAEQFWEASAAGLKGTSVERLAIYLADAGERLASALPWLLAGADDPGDEGVLATRECLVADADGELQRRVVARARFWLQGHRLTVVAILDRRDVPGWAMVDGLTGLWTRSKWEQERDLWQAWDGAVVVMDVDGLKLVNDSYGHAMGDRVLRLVGEAIRQTVPAPVAAVRWGGDEILLVRPGGDETEAQHLAEAVNERLAQLLQEAGPPADRVRLSYGVAAYQAGRLNDGMQRADAALYRHKGTVLQARQGRLVLYPSGRAALLAARPTGTVAELAALVGPAFARLCALRTGTARWRAADFLDWVAPSAGSAAVLVGLGYQARLLFEGGLARRIGPEGQLLATDGDVAALVQARRRAYQEGLGWVHFLPALPHDLPLGPRCAAWIICGAPLHVGNLRQVLSELARVVEARGVVALALPLRWDFGAAWRPALAVLEAAAAAGGRSFSLRWPLGLQATTVEAAAATAGLQLEAYWQAVDEGMFRSPEEELTAWWGSGVLEGLLADLDDEGRKRTEAAFLSHLRRMADGPDDPSGRWLAVHWRYFRLRLAPGAPAPADSGGLTGAGAG